MCFSPAASFIAAAGLAAVGVASLKRTAYPRERALAAVPIVFAAQQFIEGILWLCLLHGYWAPAQYWLTQVYAGFAGAVWPVLIPASLLLIEPREDRRRLMGLVTFLGAAVALYTIQALARFGFDVQVANNCILYEGPKTPVPFAVGIYVLATCTAFFFSSHRLIRWLGVANVLAFLAAYYFYRINLTSVWCFFAAILSALIYLFFVRIHPQPVAVHQERSS